ncbi:MAG TPA: stage II sporulation protein E [Desulfotomaculum sp.]|nr:stage II sporulation protein E [Desulfotomaculum sp.]
MSDKTDVYPYKRSGDDPVLFRRPFKKGAVFNSFGTLQEVLGLISPGMLLSCTAAFFLGRAVLLGELLPFQAAYAAAAAIYYGRSGIIPLAFLCAGAATVTGGFSLAAGISLAIVTFLVVQAVPPKYKDHRAVIPVLVFGLAISVRSAFSAYTGSTPYDYISILFEGIFAGALAPVCIAALSSARKLKGVQPLGGEEMVCLILFAAGVIAGTVDLHIWQVSAMGFLSRIIILLAALAGGPGLGAAAGAVAGIIPGLSYTVTPYIVGAYSFSGVLAGLGGTLGKVGIALSFLASNILLSVYFSNFASMESVIAETGLACLAFLLIPGEAVRGISASVSRAQSGSVQDSSREALQSAFRQKTREYSSLFKQMASSFGESTMLSEKKLDEQGLKEILDGILKKVCVDCGMRRSCWEKDYYRMYHSLLEMFAITEANGRVEVGDIPPEVKGRCSRPRDLATAAGCLYETFKVDRHWRRKFISGRVVVGDQLRGMAGVFESLGDEFNISADEGGYADSDLKLRLRQLGIPVNEIRINQFKGRREMQVTMKSCRGDLDCRYRVAPVISELVGQLFSVSGCFCEGRREGACSFRIYQGPHYRVEVGVASSGSEKDSVSGDVYDFLQLRGGKFAAVLSDGMGTGADAARESASAVNLLRRMLEAGINVELTMKTINAVQSLRNPEESFSAMDMTVVNLYSGQAEFIKNAAPPTYIIRGGRLISISTSSLPVGILRDIDINIIERKLASGDVIVMITDGILSSRRGEDREGWITGVLRELNGLEPKEMAGLLLKLAQTGSGEETAPRDDMAVVVIRVEREKVVEIPL